jgi:RimJ/RimL family protein N-acetyltransferase
MVSNACAEYDDIKKCRQLFCFGWCNMDICHKNISLTAVSAEDADLLLKMINDPEMESSIIGWSLPVSTEQQLLWLQNRDSIELSTIRFIVKNCEGLSVGVVSLSEIDWKNRSADINIKIVKQCQGLGLGKQAVYALIKYSFEQLNLNRLEADILETNVPSRKIFEKCGFSLEGSKRESIYKNNAYIDVRIYSILKSDFAKKSPED